MLWLIGIRTSFNWFLKFLFDLWGIPYMFSLYVFELISRHDRHESMKTPSSTDCFCATTVKSCCAGKEGRFSVYACIVYLF